MKKIKYFNNEFVDYKITQKEYTTSYYIGNKEFTKTKTKDEKEPIFEITQKEYECTDKEFSYWLDVIKKTYGKFGEVTYEEIEDKLTEEEKEKQEFIKALSVAKINDITNKNINKNLMLEIAKLKIDIQNLKKEGIK